MIEHCIAAFRREKEEETERLRFQSYVADALKTISENTTYHYMYGMRDPIRTGQIMENRYLDLVRPAKEKKQEPEDTRSCGEIATDMWQRIRGGGQ